MTRYPRLFSAGRIGPLTLRNRILMAPMEKNLALPTGAVTRRYIDYCEARAAGGAALILLESMYVHPAGKNHRYQLGLHDDDLVPGYRRLIEACHRHGALVGAQLQFAGRETSSAITGTQPVAPSPVPCTALTGGDVPRPLEIEEIHALVDAFAEAARRAVAAGFDAARDPRGARLPGGPVPLALRQPPRRRVRRRFRAAPALSPRGDRGRAPGGRRPLSPLVPDQRRRARGRWPQARGFLPDRGPAGGGRHRSDRRLGRHLRIGPVDRPADGDGAGLPGAAGARDPSPRRHPGQRGGPDQRRQRGRARPRGRRRRLRHAGARPARGSRDAAEERRGPRGRDLLLRGLPQVQRSAGTERAGALPGQHANRAGAAVRDPTRASATARRGRGCRPRRPRGRASARPPRPLGDGARAGERARWAAPAGPPRPRSRGPGGAGRPISRGRRRAREP